MKDDKKSGLLLGGLFKAGDSFKTMPLDTRAYDAAMQLEPGSEIWFSPPKKAGSKASYVAWIKSKDEVENSRVEWEKKQSAGKSRVGL